MRDLAAAHVFRGRDQDKDAVGGGRGVPRGVGLLQENSEVKKGMVWDGDGTRLVQ